MVCRGDLSAIRMIDVRQVSSVSSGGSAFASNKITKGDFLVAVKDLTSGKTIEQTCKLVLGPEGTDVTLRSVERNLIGTYLILSLLQGFDAPRQQQGGFLEFDCVLRRGNTAGSSNQESTPSPLSTFQDDLAETTDKLLQEAQVWAMKSKLSHIHKAELEETWLKSCCADS
eukprot:765512-Hanusia_phi.AAC.6